MKDHRIEFCQNLLLRGAAVPRYPHPSDALLVRQFNYSAIRRRDLLEGAVHFCYLCVRERDLKFCPENGPQIKGCAGTGAGDSGLGEAYDTSVNTQQYQVFGQRRNEAPLVVRRLLYCAGFSASYRKKCNNLSCMIRLCVLPLPRNYSLTIFSLCALAMRLLRRLWDKPSTFKLSLTQRVHNSSRTFSFLAYRCKLWQDAQHQADAAAAPEAGHGDHPLL